MLQRISRIRSIHAGGIIQKRAAAGWPADGSNIERWQDWPKVDAPQPDYQDMPRQSSGSPTMILGFLGIIGAWAAAQIYFLRPVERAEVVEHPTVARDMKMSEERIRPRPSHGGYNSHRWHTDDFRGVPASKDGVRFL